MTYSIQYKGHEERLNLMKEYNEKEQKRTKEFEQEAAKLINKAYESAKLGDMYEAYLNLDGSIKATAASMRTNVEQNPLLYSFIVPQHWDELNHIAQEAAKIDTRAKKRLENSFTKLEKQRKINQRDWDGLSILF